MKEKILVFCIQLIQNVKLLLKIMNRSVMLNYNVMNVKKGIIYKMNNVN